MISIRRCLTFFLSATCICVWLLTQACCVNISNLPFQLSPLRLLSVSEKDHWSETSTLSQCMEGYIKRWHSVSLYLCFSLYNKWLLLLCVRDRISLESGQVYNVMFVVPYSVLFWRLEGFVVCFPPVTPKFLKSLQALSETTEDYETLVSNPPFRPQLGKVIGSVLFLTCWLSLHDKDSSPSALWEYI